MVLNNFNDVRLLLMLAILINIDSSDQTFGDKERNKNFILLEAFYGLIVVVYHENK